MIDYEEVNKMRWFLVDSVDGSIWVEPMEATTRDAAEYELISEWEGMTDADKGRRTSFGCAYAEDEDDIYNDTICIETMVLYDKHGRTYGMHIDMILEQEDGTEELLEQVSDYETAESYYNRCDDLESLLTGFRGRLWAMYKGKPITHYDINK